VNRLQHAVAFVLVGAIAALTFGTPASADPIRDAEWHLAFLNVPEAHKYSQGDGVIVGIVDTGVDASHPDLAGNVLTGKDFTGTSNDGRQDINGHGTGMAGLIAAHGRVLGIAPKAKILPVRSKIDNYGAGSTAAAWAVDNGARVLCLAYGEADSATSREAIQRAIDNDIVVVAAVGNEPRLPGVDYPAAYPGVVGAAGVDRNGNHAAISVLSPFAMLAAPAVDIATTDIRTAGHTGYANGVGTSAATAIIAGAAALVRAKYPNLSATEVIHRLTATADDKGTPGRDNEYGYGVINLVKALTADVSALEPTTTPTTTTTTTPTLTQATPPQNTDGTLATTILIAGALLIIAALCAAFITIALRQRAR
jgi:type VII secretion-associated serine protease mycosin